MGRPCQCRCGSGAPPHLCCQLRRFTGAWANEWSEPLVSNRECTSRVIDMQMVSDVLYVVGWSRHLSAPVAQAWDTDGNRTWSVDLDSDFTPFRIASNGTLVWVVGTAPVDSSTKELQAFAASNGAAQWDAVIPFGAYSVCSDGAGGCFVGTSESPEGNDTGCESPDSGPIRRYNSSGSKTAHFGRNGGPQSEFFRTTDLLVLGGKLWAGSGGFNAWMCCDISDGIHWFGHLARYTFAGALEILCSNPHEPGGGAGSAVASILPADSYVNRLATVSGRLFAGYQRNLGNRDLAGDEMYCSLVEWDPDNGRMVSGYSLETDDSLDDVRWGLMGLDTGSNFLAMTFDKNSFAKTDLSAVEDKSLGGLLLPAVDSSDNVYGALQPDSLCRNTNEDQDVTIESCDPIDPCDCGKPTTFGRMNVDCGCEDEDDGVPCTGSLTLEFTGCLADFGTTLAIYLVDDEPAEWRGEYTVMSPEDCEADYVVTAIVKHQCPATPTGTGGGTWTIRVEITEALVVSNTFGFEVEADSQTCSGDNGLPGFTFSADESDLFGTFPACLGCGSFDVCGGMNDSSCGVNVDCCENTLPTTLHATFTNAGNCACAADATIPLTWDGDTWDGTGTLGSCGQSITLSLSCDEGGAGWTLTISGCHTDSLGLSEDGCDPLELSSAPFFPTTCCGDAGAAVYVTITE